MLTVRGVTASASPAFGGPRVLRLSFTLFESEDFSVASVGPLFDVSWSRSRDEVLSISELPGLSFTRFRDPMGDCSALGSESWMVEGVKARSGAIDVWLLENSAERPIGHFYERMLHPTMMVG